MFNNTLSGYSGGSQNLSGVFSFSDGMGTVIENGTITTNKAFVNNSSVTQNNQLATKQYVDINGASALLSSNNIWFGTENGLWLYDGKNLKKSDLNNILTGNSIYAMTFYKDRMWIALKNNEIYIIDNGKFEKK